MSDSGASSPLSSASSSRVLSPALPSTPPGARTPRIGNVPSSLKSDRSRRSPTSSTVPFSEVSELTEEEEEEEEEEEYKEDQADNVKDATENGNQEVEEEDDEPLSEVEDVDEEPDPVRVVPARSRNASRSESSPSLTPPPPSEIVASRPLPSSEGSPTPSGEDKIREPITVDRDAASEQAIAEDEEEADDADDAEDEGEDGDVTMRPANDEEAAESGEEADGVDGEEPVEEDQEQEDGDEAMDDEAVEEDGEAQAAGTASLAPAPARSSHAPAPSAAHIKSLLVLELKFAALRDKLYLERMEEAAAEEEMLLNGSHPALTHLHQILSERREKLHEVATQRHKATLAELVRAREASKAHVWSWWTEERDRMHWDEFENTWSKRRRLAREKNEIETPRVVKPVPRVGDQSTRAFDWSAGATPSRVSNEEAARDLALMETRRVQQSMQSHHSSRHMSPAIFGPAQNPAPHDPSRQMTSTQPQPNYAFSQVHQAFSQPRTATASQPQPQMPPGSVSGPSRASSSQAPSQSQPPPQQPPAQPRREGRTVPTTSDMFEGRKDGYMSTASSLSWPKPPEHRTNGHNGVSHKETAATAAPAKQEERRFPGLAEYLGGSKSSSLPVVTSHSQASGHSSYSSGPAKVLSPPPISASSVLTGTFGPRPSIPTAQPTGTTAAGGSDGR